MENPIQAYLNECCSVHPAARSWTDILYDSFSRWLNRHGDEFGISKQAFVRDLIKLTGSESRVGTNNRKFIQGVNMEGEAWRWTPFRTTQRGILDLSFDSGGYPIKWEHPMMAKWRK